MAKRIDSVRAWGVERICKWPYLVILKDGGLEVATMGQRPTCRPGDTRPVRVRIIREADYRRLLKQRKTK
jgi:hypothetical protein